jgi:hypothetical protein
MKDRLKNTLSQSTSSILILLNSQFLLDITALPSYDVLDTDMEIIQSFEYFSSDEEFYKFKEFCTEIQKVVFSNQTKTDLNSRPIIFFLYYLAMHHKAALIAKYPSVQSDLIPIFSQLGISSGIQS